MLLQRFACAPRRSLLFPLLFSHPHTSFSPAGHLTHKQRKHCALDTLQHADASWHVHRARPALRSGGSHQQPQTSDANSNVTVVVFQRHRQLGEGVMALHQVITVGRLLLLTGQLELLIWVVGGGGYQRFSGIKENNGNKKNCQMKGGICG